MVGVSKTPVCSSPYSYTNSKGAEITGRELSKKEIKEIEELFISSAIRAYKAGYDGVELHGCHSYLLSQFLNKNVNLRTDEYGKNRSLILENIIKGIREHTSSDFSVGIRLGAFEPTLSDGIENALKCQELGFDFLNISYGFTRESQPYCPDDFPLKDIIWAGGQIKKSVNIPCFAVNGIQSKEQFVKALDLCDVDMVCIGRGVLVNYNWAKDVLNNINPGKCLYCKTCMWRVDPSKCPGKISYLKQII